MPLPPGRGATMLRRGRTLVRPERQQSAEPMIQKTKRKLTPWVIYSRVITFWCPAFFLSKLGKMPDPGMQQAWREKIALVSLIALVCGVVVYLTLFLPMTFCRGEDSKLQDSAFEYDEKGKTGGGIVGYLGQFTNIADSDLPSTMMGFRPGQDVTPYFQRPVPQSCTKVNSNFLAARASSEFLCQQNNGNEGCPFDQPLEKIIKNPKDNIKKDRPIGYSWDNFPPGYAVINGMVLNFSPYLSIVREPRKDDLLDKAIRQATDEGVSDITVLFASKGDLMDAVPCIKERYNAGVLAKDTIGCFSVNLYNYFALVIIMGIVLIRFFMALIFQYFLSWQLVRRPSKDKVAPLSYNANAPWSGKAPTTGGAKVKLASGEADELYTALLVTCYSEGDESMRGTCNSLAATQYSDSRKLLFMIADGIIKGDGEERSTPDICVDMIEQDPQFLDPQPCSYIAVAAGSKQHNMAKVYCGHYVYQDHRVPSVIVVKCGTPEEANNPKPGNRGKRDSQIILMNFFSRAIYNDRMTPLDYDLFRKVHHLMGVTPDLFEIVLMVDADTKVYPDSLRLLVNCMNNDQQIMGICGETKIANKRDSWVTAIQVFEYYISHHLAKAFESVFGGVTCLPGCFCMYRLKARKGTDWVPVLTKPEICEEYSQNVVETLHEKNLLLLGEDRFLSTLMLRTFPKRKMMFMPQAICKTLVPDSFKVLLSQRRRWINSTVHNLMELVLVKDLCGTFCLSMQFSVMLDLIGTVALPVAIILTYILIVRAATTTYDSATKFVPLVMLITVLFLPGVLILVTTRKWIYVGWMLIYLIALPVWNLILPVYAYWHFDDFSWGETRKVQGETKGDSHGGGDGVFDGSKVPMRRWEDYERRRLRSIRRKKRDGEKGAESQTFGSQSQATIPESEGLISNSQPSPVEYYEDQPRYDYLEGADSSIYSPHPSQAFNQGAGYPPHPSTSNAPPVHYSQAYGGGAAGGYSHAEEYELQPYPSAEMRAHQTSSPFDDPLPPTLAPAHYGNQYEYQHDEAAAADYAYQQQHQAPGRPGGPRPQQ
ncbi:hypothetical protein H4219_002657 [Mycoemilia scoparia]|uniref:chitin synthase n=1 Tax=Mycoemilia scoparia TaxID=417184 RepID=A0A9W8A6B2_9FUNG|nr:hypothetical protein H4219_002657 [Mycoemilia scoparia]